MSRTHVRDYVAGVRKSLEASHRLSIEEYVDALEELEVDITSRLESSRSDLNLQRGAR